MPKASDAAIAILEWVDKFQLVVEDAGLDEGMCCGRFEKREKLVHQVRHAVGFGSHMGNDRSFENPHISGSPRS